MKKLEILGLITMVYDYEPNFEKHGIESQNPLLAIVNEAFKFLQRKRYFDKEGRPTKKLYKLVDLYDVRIKVVQDARDQEEQVEEEIEK